MRYFWRAFPQLTLFHIRSLYRNKVAFFFNLIFPLMMVAVFGSVFSPKDPADNQIRIGWSHTQDGAATDVLATALRRSERYIIVEDTETTLLDALQDGAVRAVVTAPEGLDGMLRGGGHDAAPVDVTVLYDPTSASSSQTAGELRQVIGVVDAQLQGAHSRIQVHIEPAAEREALSVFDYLIPGQLVVMLLAAGLITVSIGMTAQRQRGVLRHLFSTPLSLTAWTAARIIANLVMASFQVVLLYAFAWLLFRIDMPEFIGRSALVIAIATLTSLSLGMLIGSFVKDDGGAFAVGMPLFMAMIFFGNAAMPLEDPPAFIAVIQKFIPAFYMTEAMRAVMMKGADLVHVSGELALLIGLAAVSFSIALIRLRRQYVAV